MLIGYLAFIELFARLRTALTHADTRFVRVLEELFDGVYVVDTSMDEILYANRRLAMIVGRNPRQMRAADVERQFRASTSEALSRIALDAAPSPSTFSTSEIRDAIGDRWRSARPRARRQAEPRDRGGARHQPEDRRVSSRAYSRKARRFVTRGAVPGVSRHHGDRRCRGPRMTPRSSGPRWRPYVYSVM
jgi:hypothetical protein